MSATLGAAAREPSDEDFPGPEGVAVGALLGCAFNLPRPPIFAHLFDRGAIVRGCLREAGTRAEGHPEGKLGCPSLVPAVDQPLLIFGFPQRDVPQLVIHAWLDAGGQSQVPQRRRNAPTQWRVGASSCKS